MSEKSSRSRDAVALPVITAVLTALCAACGSVGAPPGPRMVQSRYELSTGRVIVRDCGYSVPLPGQPGRDLWLFCDTEITGRQGQEIGSPILGTGTAAVGPYRAGQAPGPLTEVAAPGHGRAAAGTAPQPFLPSPAGLTLLGGTLPCAAPRAYPARWITGVTREPGPPGLSGHLLITYADYCVSGASAFTPEAFGLLDYDPADNVAGRPVQVFGAAAGQPLPAQRLLGSPIFRGGYLYLFGSCGPDQGCGRGGVVLVRTVASPAGWQEGPAYRYWTGSGWSASPAGAATLPGPATAVEVSAADYSADGHGLVMIEQTSVVGDFSVWQAAAPTGPWRRVQTGRVPCTTGRQAGAGGLCRALIGHPELSTGTDLLLSFFDPGADHLEVIGYPW
jgi:hypothetical protein